MDIMLWYQSMNFFIGSASMYIPLGATPQDIDFLWCRCQVWGVSIYPNSHEAFTWHNSFLTCHLGGANHNYNGTLVDGWGFEHFINLTSEPRPRWHHARIPRSAHTCSTRNRSGENKNNILLLWLQQRYIFLTYFVYQHIICIYNTPRRRLWWLNHLTCNLCSQHIQHTYSQHI